MKTATNDKGELVMVPEMDRLAKISLLWPAAIESVKQTIKTLGVQKAIDQVKAFKMDAMDKGGLLFIASGFRLTRKF